VWSDEEEEWFEDAEILFSFGCCLGDMTFGAGTASFFLVLFSIESANMVWITFVF
jgi:hypothetical protein